MSCDWLDICWGFCAETCTIVNCLQITIAYFCFNPACTSMHDSLNVYNINGNIALLLIQELQKQDKLCESLNSEKSSRLLEKKELEHTITKIIKDSKEATARVRTM